MGTLNNEIDNTRKKIEELGMFCLKYGIEKADLQEVASRKVREEDKKKHEKKRKGY